MKRPAMCGVTILMLAVFSARAGIIAGPITNPANGHEYYLLAENSWSASQAEAKELGGTLAIVDDASEQGWIFEQFGFYGGTERSLWIGLRRKESGGPFVWVNGAPLDYANWYSRDGEPNNAGGIETCVHMRAGTSEPGTWNDLHENARLNGVVEVAAKRSLTRKQRALAGTWYENGKADRLCRVTSADNVMFAINESHNSSGRIIFNRQGFLFVSSWRVHGEVVKDRILWSNGTWWSRTPLSFTEDPAQRE